MNATLTPSDKGHLTTPTEQRATSCEAPRKLRPVRFGSGMLLMTTGMGMILMVGVQMLEVRRIGGDFALILVAGGVLTGVTLLGGGFGLMATASSGFDEREFDHLMQAGNISSSSMSLEPQDSFPETAERALAVYEPSAECDPSGSSKTAA
jgi:hypothetical protein